MYRACAGAVVVNNAGSILIGQRYPAHLAEKRVKQVHFMKCVHLLIHFIKATGWQFPQGGVEPGETYEQAALREAVEEMGLITEDV
jgi:putative (di)nucleoside polyphosphate hydrolase